MCQTNLINKVFPSSTRNSSVELLRIVFMFLIVVGHVYAHGSNLNYQLIYSYGGQFDTFWHTSIFSLSKVGVTGFMFITGYYGIRFDFKKLLLLFCTALFYFLILSRFSNPINAIHPYSCWWYLNSYIFIYVLSPFIEYGFKNIEEPKIRIVVLVLLFYNYIGKAGENSHDTELLLSIYVIARYIKLYSSNLQKISRKFKLSTVLGLTILFLLIVSLPIIEYNAGLPLKAYKMTISNNSIIILLFVIFLVRFADSHETHSNFVNWVAASTLSVYLITDYPSIRDIIDPYLFEGMQNGKSYVLIVLIFLSCILIDKLRMFLFALITGAFAKRADFS